MEDGVIWVYGVGEDGVRAFADFGIENLIELIKVYGKTPDCSGGDRSTRGLRRMDTADLVIGEKIEYAGWTVRS